MTHTTNRRTGGWTPARRRAVVLAAAAFVLALGSWTPGEAGQKNKWWKSEIFQRELRLTQEQVDRIEEIFQETLPALQRGKRALDEAEAAFERLVERSDEPQIQVQVERVERARSDLNVSHTMMLVRMRRVLTTDQWAGFTVLYQAERARLAGGGAETSGR